MTSRSRNFISLAVIAATLLTAVIWSLMYLYDATDDADRAAADTAAVQTAVKRIQLSRPEDAQTERQEQQSAQLPKRLDDAMKASGIDAENLERISPQPARHFGQGELQEIPLQLVFHQATLKNILQFVSTLKNENHWLSIRDIHFARPQSASSQTAMSEWDVELTVSYLIKSTASTTGAN